MDYAYKRAMELKEHFIAIGEKKIRLNVSDPDLPWDKVTDFNPGMQSRNGMITNGYFLAEIPMELDAVLLFEWSFDIEADGVEGTEAIVIDLARCWSVMNSLKGNARKEFKDYLLDCEQSVRKLGTKYQNMATNQVELAEKLLELRS